MTGLNTTVSFIKRLRRGQTGHVAVIFALALIPMVAVAGFAIDFQMTTTSKNRVQTIMDSAVLAGAKEMQAGSSNADVKSLVRSYMEAQLHLEGTKLSCDTAAVSVTNETQLIEVDMLCEQGTSLMNIMGRDEVPFRVRAASTWGIGKLDVAFMFDVSGSMSSNNRMVHLKDAALDAIDTILPADGGPAVEDVRIAMVSYDTMVDAGDYFEDVTGLAAERTYIFEEEVIEITEFEYQGECKALKPNKKNCKRRYVCEDWDSDGECEDWDRERVCIPYEASQTENEFGNCDVFLDQSYTVTETRTIESTCVFERPGNGAFTDAAPNTNTAISEIYVDANEIVYHAGSNNNSENFMAAGYAEYVLGTNDDPDEGWWDIEGTDCNPHGPVPLTNNRTTLINYVNSLTTNSLTAGQQGIAWAWYTVAPDWGNVFTGSSAPLAYDEPDSTKAVILMTDGSFNSQEFYSDLGSSFEQAEEVCDAIKDVGSVYIYTIAFQAPSSGQAILEYCASGPEFAFAPENGQELTDAYQQIATSISDLRIKY
ncbi:MAG: TadE/TadG family type IV pilus assembly protein [Pseudomonadota bacterium]